MAITESEKERTILATWVPTSLAAQVKQEAKGERRSVSSYVRHLLEDNFAAPSSLRAAEAVDAPAAESFLTQSRSGAGEEEG